MAVFSGRYAFVVSHITATESFGRTIKSYVLVVDQQLYELIKLSKYLSAFCSIVVDAT